MRGKAEAQSIYPNAYLKLPKKNYETHKVSRNFLGALNYRVGVGAL